MKYIKPSEISSKIMSLIEESDEYVILVSPYVKISKWYKLIKKLDNLKSRNVPFEFIIRNDANNQNSFDELNHLQYKYEAIPDLHAKLYLNEKYAIVTSMNLLLNSEINSLEIGYQTETPKEHAELYDFCKRHLSINFNNEEPNPVVNSKKDWQENVYDALVKNLNMEISMSVKERGIDINIKSSVYKCFIANSKFNELRLSCTLTTNEFNKGQSLINDFESIPGLKINLQSGGSRYDHLIWGTLEEKLKCWSLLELSPKEQNIVSKNIIDFVTTIEKYKSNNQ